MSDPEYTLDPGAKKFLSNVAASTYTHSSQQSIYGAVDNSPVPPNHSVMNDLTRQELDAKLAASEAKVDARLANFDTSIKSGFADMRTDIAKLTGDMRADLTRLQSEMHKNTTDIIKWVVVTALGLATATVTILTFVINNASPKTAAPSTAQQTTPVILAVPAGSTLLNPSPPAPSSPAPR